MPDDAGFRFLWRKGKSVDKWQGKQILLGVTGGVAAFKAVAMASALTQMGAAVDVAMTPAAREFVTELQFAAVTRRQVHIDPWVSDRQPEHIALADRPDLIVVAPATANTIAKIAHGLADNLLTSVILATRKPVLLAPAMNVGMYANPATRDNIETLRRRGYHLVGPNAGYLACGYEGQGRMAEPGEIIAAMDGILFQPC